jgi:putative glycosyltransferase (TIGR04348 family)
MRIFMACPAPRGSRKGNRVTAERWAGFLRELGHEVTIGHNFNSYDYDLLVALHARRSASAVMRFHAAHPNRPIVVALTGTDLYRDIHTNDARPHLSLAVADRLILLQPKGRDELPRAVRHKARVIYQSSIRSRVRPRRSVRHFDVCVLGHLRHEKDPLRAALASRLLPETSRTRITHAGQALSPFWQKRARAEMARNRRYRWLGEVSAARARRVLTGSRLLVLSSRMEGGANVISEALVEGVPVVASRIAGSVGLLGEKYPGYFPVGDTRALAALLRRAEEEPAYYRRLDAWCARLAPRFEPARERAAWAALLEELV